MYASLSMSNFDFRHMEVNDNHIYLIRLRPYVLGRIAIYMVMLFEVF
jgi:hypothetical protein